MYFFVCFAQVTIKLGLSDALGQKRKRLWVFIARLRFELRKIDGAPIQTSRGSRFEAFKLKAEFNKSIGNRSDCSFPRPAPFCFRFAGVHHRLQERSRCENHGWCAVNRLPADTHPLNLAVLHKDIFDHFLNQCQILLIFHAVLHQKLIRFFVGLCARRVHRRAFGTVEQTKLNPGFVDHTPHFPTQSVNLSNDLPFRNATDRRVTAHLPDGVAIHRQQRAVCAQSGRCQRRLSPRMTCPDNDHVKLINRFSHKLQIYAFAYLFARRYFPNLLPVQGHDR